MSGDPAAILLAREAVRLGARPGPRERRTTRPPLRPVPAATRT